MSKYIPGNQKHLTLENRIYIENELNKGTSFKDIAKFLCMDPTTISKEVMAHRLSDWYHKGTFYNAKNFCVHRYHCKKTHACGKIFLFGIQCASCPTCNQTESSHRLLNRDSPPIRSSPTTWNWIFPSERCMPIWTRACSRRVTLI